MAHPGRRDEIAVDVLAELVDELLDVLCDTVCFGGDDAGDPAWAAHLDYLRDLQRVGHQVRAQLEFALSD